jgi:spore germination protein KC
MKCKKSGWIKLAALLTAGSLLTGCSKASPLGSRLFAEAAGVDAGDAGFAVTVMGYVADQGEEGGSLCRTAGGASLTGALAALTGQTGREPYFPHNGALVVGESTARQGMAPVLLFFADYPGCRAGVPLIIAEQSAASVVMKLAQDDAPDVHLLQQLTDPVEMAGRTVSTPLYTALTAEGVGDFAAPLVQASEDGLYVTGTALCRSGVMTGRLTAEETVGLHLLNGTLKNALVQCELPEGRAVVAVTADEMKCVAGAEVRLNVRCRGQIFEAAFPVRAGETGPLASMLAEQCRQQLTAWAASALRKLQRAESNVCGWADFRYDAPLMADISVEMMFFGEVP